MPTTPEDTLQKLVEAMTEAKATISEVHQARAAALDVEKAHRKRIAEQVDDSVRDYVNEIKVEAHAQMRVAIDGVIDRIERDWRAKLGLS